jgi:hypothetical protein
MEGARLKLRLEDQGDGWFWDCPAIEVDVTGESWGHSRLYHKVRLRPPLEREEPDAAAPPGSRRVVHRTAWISARWVGHEFSSEHGTPAFLWLASEGGESVPPSADSPPSARVMCRVASLRAFH